MSTFGEHAKLVRSWITILLYVVRPISGCDFPAKPVIDPFFHDFIYCHPRFGPTCPVSTVCQYRWLGYYICCNVDQLTDANLQHVNFSAITFETPPRSARLLQQERKTYPQILLRNATDVWSPAQRVSTTAQHRQAFDIAARLSINTINDTLFVGGGRNWSPPSKQGNASTPLKVANDPRPITPPWDIAGASAHLLTVPKNVSTANIGLFEPTTPTSVNVVDGSPWPKVTILLQGDWIRLSELRFQFPSTVTLVQDGATNIIIDTGVPTDRTKILQGLRIAGLQPEQINYVVLSHGHPDHFGNAGMFPSVAQYFGTFTYRGNVFQTTDLLFKDTVQLTPNVILHRSPGHTAQDITTLVRNVNGSQTVAIVGDLFTNEADIDLPEFWTIVSANPTQQSTNRKVILCAADVIVPGHGRLFRVTEKLRRLFKCENSGSAERNLPRVTRRAELTTSSSTDGTTLSRTSAAAASTVDDSVFRDRRKKERKSSSSSSEKALFETRGSDEVEFH